jgi:hypothetical protein
MNGVPLSTWEAMPPGSAPRAPTWKTKAPRIGSESAEIARQATV